MVEKWTFVFSFCFALMILSPFIYMLISGISASQEIDPSFLSGFITASGILAGFITSSAISRKETLESHHYFMVVVNLATFVFALNSIFAKHLIYIGKPDFGDFIWVMVSINANAFTALVIAWRLLIHRIKEASDSQRLEDHYSRERQGRTRFSDLDSGKTPISGVGGA